jgi:dihydroxyacetone kinase-like predicted kinase
MKKSYEVIAKLEVNPEVDLKRAQDELKRELSRIGNSLGMMISSKNKAKIHIHTDQPAKAREIIRSCSMKKPQTEVRFEVQDLSNEP